MFTKRKVAMLVTEFLGTMLLALLVLATVKSYLGILDLNVSGQYAVNFGSKLFLALASGVGLATLVAMFGSVSGSVFNPAITFALWTVRQITAIRMLGFVIAQFLGAAVAFVLHEYLTGGDYTWGSVATDFSGAVLTAEVIGAAVLAFGFAAAMYRGFNGGVRAATIGMAYFFGILVAGIASIGVINPAVAFSVEGIGWIMYVLGPILGAVIGMNAYNLIFAAATVGDSVPAPATSSTATVAPVKKPVVAKKEEVAKTSTVKAKAAAAKPVAKKKTTVKK